MSAHFDFAYVESSIPAGMTVREWCLAGRPKVCPPVAGASPLGAEQALDAPVTPPVDPDAGLVL